MAETDRGWGAGLAALAAALALAAAPVAQGGGRDPSQDPAPSEGIPGPPAPPAEPAPRFPLVDRAPPTGAETPASTATPAAPEPSPAPERARPALPAFAPAYRPLADVEGLLAAYADAVPGIARRLAVAPGLNGIELGASGPLALEERPMVLLVGGLDGTSLAGGEAVLAVVDQLLRAPERLPEGVAFVAIPWASPHALGRTLEGRAEGGRDGRPLDEDGDGRADEDGPDELDGDGLLLSMLVEDPHGAWVRSADGRFLAPAREGDAPRYSLVREGRDDDHDGRFNEDPAGGVVLDRNFPVDRTGPWEDPACGPLPLSEPQVRALADLALARRTSLVILFQGNHGALAIPGGVDRPGESGLCSPVELRTFERITAAFAAATGRAQAGPMTLRRARGRERPGAALDWFHAVVGAISLELAPWGPGVDGDGEVIAQDAQFESEPQAGGQRLAVQPAAGERDRAWARWLDNTRGGLGFVEWHPVDLGEGQQALVGGWEPRTLDNPPPESLGRALRGTPELVVELASALPRLEVRVLESSREGDVCRVRARVKNAGFLPTGVGASPLRRGVSLALELPPGARLLAGEPRVALGSLQGGGTSETCAWIVMAPPGSVLGVRASADCAAEVVREVRP
jgi:hypothetical protein